MALETIDLNGSETMFVISNKLDLEHIFPSKVSIWKLRTNNPMRKSFSSLNINFDQFDALLKITVEMSKYLYPYIRAILSSRDNYKSNPELWQDFKRRYIELIEERFNTESILVKNLINLNNKKTLYEKILLNLALCPSNEGYNRLKMILLNL